jgi:hypothetical protein
MTPSDDDVLERVAALPRHDVSLPTAARIRALSLAEFAAQPAGASEPAPELGFFSRFIEPALLVASVVSYLFWTTSTLTSLHAASALTAGNADRGANIER